MLIEHEQPIDQRRLRQPEYRPGDGDEMFLQAAGECALGHRGAAHEGNQIEALGRDADRAHGPDMAVFMDHQREDYNHREFPTEHPGIGHDAGSGEPGFHHLDRFKQLRTDCNEFRPEGGGQY